MSHNTNHYGVSYQSTGLAPPSVLRQANPRPRHKPHPTSSIPSPSKLRPLPTTRTLGAQTTAQRTAMQPSSMIRQPNPKERGLHKKSLSKTQSDGSSMRMLEPSPHWTIIEGRIEKQSFITRRDERWQRRGFTDPVGLSVLNIHGNEETYFCGFPGTLLMVSCFGLYTFSCVAVSLCMFLCTLISSCFIFFLLLFFVSSKMFSGEGTRSNTNQLEAIRYKALKTKTIQACLHCKWQLVLDLLRETPLRAEQKTDDHRYPLHLAVERNAPEEVIARLVEIHPEAAKVQTKKTKATALHIVRFSDVFVCFLSKKKNLRSPVLSSFFFLLSSFFFLLSSFFRHVRPLVYRHASSSFLATCGRLLQKSV